MFVVLFVIAQSSQEFEPPTIPGRFKKAIAAKEQRNQKPLDLKIESDDPDNANEAMKILEIVKVDYKWANLDTDYERLLLEPWAVQMALSRRRGGTKLNSEDLETIKRCTRDPDTLKWPRVKTDG